MFEQKRYQSCNTITSYYHRLCAPVCSNHCCLSFTVAGEEEVPPLHRLLCRWRLLHRLRRQKCHHFASNHRSNLYVLHLLSTTFKTVPFQLSGSLEDYYPIYAWDVVDIFFATVVASLPALNASVDKIFGKIKDYSLGSKTSHTSFSFTLRLLGKKSRGSTSRPDSANGSRVPPTIVDSTAQADEIFQPIMKAQSNRHQESSIRMTNYPGSEMDVRAIV